MDTMDNDGRKEDGSATSFSEEESRVLPMKRKSASSSPSRVPQAGEEGSRRKSDEEASDDKKMLYEPEPTRPEWLELPTELRGLDFSKKIDDSKDNSPSIAASWDKFSPYVANKPFPLVPLNTPPVFEGTPSSPALCFYVHALHGRARAATIQFPNGGPPVPTPRFMPVGTKGTLKGVLPDEIRDMDCPLILANTYHLAIQPGTQLIDELFGGLHNFMGGTATTSSTAKSSNGDHPHPYPRLYNLLTDSGGFQMVSLAALSNVTEEGVVFQSPYSGEPLLLRPEDSIKCQNEIGADIIMQLDDVISSVASDSDRFKVATFRTLRWYDRCVKAHRHPDRQNLYPILQGHLDTTQGGLRELCMAGFKHRDMNPIQVTTVAAVVSEREQDSVVGDGNDENIETTTRIRTIPGFAIGGLAGGESKDEFWRVVDHACRHLPDDRPRYLMGVGYPLDLVVCTALGVDQYDCVYPTRTARFGVALVDEGQMKLRQHQYAPRYSSTSTPETTVDDTPNDDDVKQPDNSCDVPIDINCRCEACRRKISRGRLHSLLKANNPIAVQLITQHNVTYMMDLVTRMRNAILENKFDDFVRMFMKKRFGKIADVDEVDLSKVPKWVQDALHAAGISLL